MQSDRHPLKIGPQIAVGDVFFYGYGCAPGTLWLANPMSVAAYLARTSPAGGQGGDAATLDIIAKAIYPARDRTVDHVDVIRTESGVADGAAIFLIDRQFVLFVAPFEHPDAADVQRTAMLRIAESLPASLSRTLLPIIGSGHFEERSFLVLPRCTPLSAGRLGRFLDKKRVADDILPWLRDLAAWKAHAPDDPGRFIASLNALIRMDDLPVAVRETAQRMERQLRDGAIRPWHVPMHGDLWRNNVMRRDDGSLAVIDWAGSEVDGYGIYDLVRFKQSFNIADARYRSELRWYAELMGGEDAVMAHLLGALGHYADRLGEFPRERFVTLAADCYALLNSGLSGRPHG